MKRENAVDGVVESPSEGEQNLASSSADEISTPLNRDHPLINSVMRVVAPETVISIPQASLLLLKNGWSFFLTRAIELGTDFYAMSLLSKIGPYSASASSLIFASKVFLRSINATYLMIAPFVIKGKINNGESNQVGAVMFHNAVIATGLTAIFTPAILFSRSIFSAMNQPEEAAIIASQYLLYYLPGLPFTLYYISNQQCCLGLEYNTTVLLITLPVKAITLFLGYGFMYGEFGLPKLNEVGLAVSNSIAGGFGFLAFLTFYALNKNFRPFDIFWPRLKQSWPILKSLLQNGAPVFGYAAVELGSVFMATTLIGSTGNKNLAAVQPALQFGSFIANLVFAFGQTSGLQMKQKLSLADGKAVHFQSSRKLGYVALAMGELLPVAVLIAYGFARKPLVTFFLDSASALDETIVNMAEILLLTNLIGQIADTSRNIMSGALRGYGDTAFPMAVNVLTTLLINAPIAITATLAFEADPNVTLIARNSAILAGGLVLLNKYRMRSNEFNASAPDTLWSRTKTSFNSFVALFTACGRCRKRDNAVEDERSPLIAGQTP